MFSRMIQAAAVMVVAIATPALGQNWTTKMFETTSHDFGTVARGERAEFEFVLENLYVEDVIFPQFGQVAVARRRRSRSQR